jgi:phosphate-selective porin OprO/OprP
VLSAILIACVVSVPAFAQEPGTPKIPATWTFGWGDHPTLRFGDLLEIEFRARIHAELRGSSGSLGDSDTAGLDLARRRVGIVGTLGNVADFQIERELADREGWRDVYVNVRRFGPVELQAGKFKMPFGLNENTSSANLDFVYRSRAATQLAPGRDQGVMVHGRTGMLRYAWGAFAGDGDNARGISTSAGGSGLTTAGRLVAQPFRSSKSVFEDFRAGIAYTMSDVSAGVVDLRGDTALGQSFFRSKFAVQGRRRRIGIETRWRPGPFSVQSEFSRLTTERLGQSIVDADLPPLIGTAWYLQGTWIATGERKTRGADAPRRPLFEGGIGSIELAARVEAVRFHSNVAGQASTGLRAETILPRSDRVLTLGVNWWPRRWAKLQANLIRDTIAAPSDEAPVASPSSYWSQVLRLGLSL